jgi:hypothetical protein
MAVSNTCGDTLSAGGGYGHIFQKSSGQASPLASNAKDLRRQTIPLPCSRLSSRVVGVSLHSMGRLDPSSDRKCLASTLAWRCFPEGHLQRLPPADPPVSLGISQQDIVDSATR